MWAALRPFKETRFTCYPWSFSYNDSFDVVHGNVAYPCFIDAAEDYICMFEYILLTLGTVQFQIMEFTSRIRHLWKPPQILWNREATFLPSPSRVYLTFISPELAFPVLKLWDQFRRPVPAIPGEDCPIRIRRKMTQSAVKSSSRPSTSKNKFSYLKIHSINASPGFSSSNRLR